MATHHRATEHHLPYGITQYCLPPDTGERAPKITANSFLKPQKVVRCKIKMFQKSLKNKQTWAY